MKYIPVDPDHIEDYVEVWLAFAQGVNPCIDEDKAFELMVEYLQLNNLTVHGAHFLGKILRETEGVWHSKEVH